ncbi:hypothetical protein PILCRDRAFT_822433 [Piloderma croceum F 1598]|uniref:DUF6533 domain-containing protein n=1 Tax=Piloderma croceum (strain F 1598) TaxID=765440 RepID=A0A0C3FLD5_PILCF|nr:hypothetical protein PILCRDRAFT_822433 [Piloderma croceum F 1598]
MSLAPSTTSYAPFNPKASAFFKEVQNSNYLNVAFLMLLLYDHAITLDKEVAWIWTSVKCILSDRLCADRCPKAPMAAAKSNLPYKSLCNHMADSAAEDS